MYSLTVALLKKKIALGFRNVSGGTVFIDWDYLIGTAYASVGNRRNNRCHNFWKVFFKHV